MQTAFNLLFEEVLLWLSVVEPYRKGSLEATLKTLVCPSASFRPALTTVAATGCSAVSQILMVLDQYKKGEFSVLFCDDCYQGNVKNITALGQASAGKVQVEPLSFPDYAASLGLVLEKATKEGRKIDVLFMDLHPSINATKLTYAPHAINRALRQMFSAACVSPSFTLVIDNTIGLLDSKEITDLLHEFSERIAHGTLNIIVHWTAQKFDMFGTNKISGGCVCVYSQDKELLDLYQGCLGKEETIAPLNYQALQHLYTCSAGQLDVYREKIFENAEYLYKQINDRFKYSESEPKISPMLFACKQDKKNFYLEIPIRSKSVLATGVIEFLIFGHMRLRELPFACRASFGHMLSVGCGLFYGEVEKPSHYYKYRISVGLENKNLLDAYADVFNASCLAVSQAADFFNEICRAHPPGIFLKHEYDLWLLYRHHLMASSPIKAELTDEFKSNAIAFLNKIALI